jgi:hypothetical protein
MPDLVKTLQISSLALVNGSPQSARYLETILLKSNPKRWYGAYRDMSEIMTLMQLQHWRSLLERKG